MQIYKSRIGYELVIPISIMVIGVSILLASEKLWVGILFIIAITGFIVPMLATTRYFIDGEKIIIKSGIFYHKELFISSIRKIIETNNPISAPAASLFNRIELIYNKYDSVIISPLERDAFIRHLTAINPAIKVQMKEGRSPLINQ